MKSHTSADYPRGNWPTFTPPVPPLTALVMETPARPSAESARLTPEQVSESDYALRFGTLAARSSQLSALVDELLENLGQIRFDAPKLLERVKQANEAAKIASGL